MIATIALRTWLVKITQPQNWASLFLTRTNSQDPRPRPLTRKIGVNGKILLARQKYISLYGGCYHNALLLSLVHQVPQETIFEHSPRKSILFYCCLKNPELSAFDRGVPIIQTQNPVRCCFHQKLDLLHGNAFVSFPLISAVRDGRATQARLRLPLC